LGGIELLQYAQKALADSKVVIRIPLGLNPWGIRIDKNGVSQNDL
jgi:hypothetical protein